MLNIFIITFITMLTVIIAMSIGVLLAGKRISGSCGGLNNIEGLESACDLCSKPCEKRRKALVKLQSEELI